MRTFLISLAVIASSFLKAQNSVIETTQTTQDYGAVENVYKLQSDFILKNSSGKNLYLMRADAGRHVKVWTSKKTVMPGDTVTVQLYFFPEEIGKFNETVKLVTSADARPFEMKMKGEIKSIKKDDKSACYYFGRPRNTGNNKNGMIVVNNLPRKTDSLRWKMNGWGLDTAGALDPLPEDTTKSVSTEPSRIFLTTLLDRDKYKMNNIIFLVDVSGSMGDSVKLKWLKLSMQKLIDNLREDDKVSVVTYRDTVVCVGEGMNGLEKEELKTIVTGLKARGITKGNVAIQFSLELALKNYITDGNNEIILATDGKFLFGESDYKKWTATVGDKKIILSTIAFGQDKKAMQNLEEISKKGNGSFIHVQTRAMAQSAIFDEIEQKSRK